MHRNPAALFLYVVCQHVWDVIFVSMEWAQVSMLPILGLIIVCRLSRYDVHNVNRFITIHVYWSM